MSLDKKATCPPFLVVRKFNRDEDNSSAEGKQAGGDKGSSKLFSINVG